MSGEDKQKKHRLILETTLRLFKSERRIHTVAKIAQEANLAKGTLYLYFATKEEIYLELLASSFKLWHEKLRAYVTEAKPTPYKLIEFMCRSLAELTDFVDLTSKLSASMEGNVSVDFMRIMRKHMQEERLKSCQLIAKNYTQWTEEESLTRFMRFYVYAVAYWKECFPSERVVAAMPEEFPPEDQQREKYFREILEVNCLLWAVQA